MENLICSRPWWKSVFWSGFCSLNALCWIFCFIHKDTVFDRVWNYRVIHNMISCDNDDAMIVQYLTHCKTIMHDIIHQAKIMLYWFLKGENSLCHSSKDNKRLSASHTSASPCPCPHVLSFQCKITINWQKAELPESRKIRINVMK